MIRLTLHLILSNGSTVLLTVSFSAADIFDSVLCALISLSQSCQMGSLGPTLCITPETNVTPYNEPDAASLLLYMIIDYRCLVVIFTQHGIEICHLD